MPTVTDVQRAGRVSRHKFEQDPGAVSSRLPPVLLAPIENRLHLGVEGRETQVKIDKARPGHLDLVDVAGFRQRLDNTRRNIPRAPLCRFRKPHGNVAGKVAMTGIAGTLNRTFDRKPGRRPRQFRQLGKGILQEIGDDVLHGEMPCWNCEAAILPGYFVRCGPRGRR